MKPGNYRPEVFVLVLVLVQRAPLALSFGHGAYFGVNIVGKRAFDDDGGTVDRALRAHDEVAARTARGFYDELPIVVDGMRGGAVPGRGWTGRHAERGKRRERKKRLFGVLQFTR